MAALARRKAAVTFQEHVPYGLFVPDVLDATAYTLDGSDHSHLSEWPEARASARSARTS
jgi:hypothetical protein